MSFAPPPKVSQWFVNGTAGVELQPTEALREAQQWLDSGPSSWLVVLAGRTTGCGKTLAARWLLEALHERQPRAWRRRAMGTAPLWVNCGDLSVDLDACRWPSDRAALLHKVARSWLVVFDDVGTERDPRLVQGLNEARERAELLTIWTTNLVGGAAAEPGRASDYRGEARATVEFFTRYGARLTSRMMTPTDAAAGRMTAWRYCRGPDLRQSIEPRLLEQPTKPDPKPITPERIAAVIESVGAKGLRDPRRPPTAKDRTDPETPNRFAALDALDFAVSSSSMTEGQALQAVGVGSRRELREEHVRPLVALVRNQ